MVLVKASNGQMLFKKQDTSTYGNSNYITTVGPLLPTACSSSATKTATSSLPVPAPWRRANANADHANFPNTNARTGEYSR